MEPWFPELSRVLDVALAMLLGGAIGLEREFANKPAGFRTHMLVAGVAAFLVILGGALLESFTRQEAFAGAIQADPLRIMEAIITGISILGAGTIFRRGQQEFVEGLTTAASVLLVATIGISVAVERIGLAVAVTVLALLILMLLRWIDGMIRSRRPPA